jgi:hypothetical protein
MSEQERIKQLEANIVHLAEHIHGTYHLPWHHERRIQWHECSQYTCEYARDAIAQEVAS